ncbi:hypothetical protein GCM10009530_34700 [Microbispora corallina]|uniref:Uncharacterized protein n=1 Tax=Microbispora corallina TaxID=83302 RepID=A0ABQ4G1Q0_9ACTN|nr:hypothetical protein [Microbispora corallina]GIH40955.1 hypothetical protein Mco01_39550 [Microbispora corallina]
MLTATDGYVAEHGRTRLDSSSSENVLASNQLVYRLRPTRRQLFWELVTPPVTMLAAAGLIRLFGVPLDLRMAIPLSLTYTSHSMPRIAARRHAAHLVELHEGRIVVSVRDKTYEIPFGTLRSVRIKRLTRNRSLRPANRSTDKTLRRYGAQLAESNS